MNEAQERNRNRLLCYSAARGLTPGSFLSVWSQDCRETAARWPWACWKVSHSSFPRSLCSQYCVSKCKCTSTVKELSLFSRHRYDMLKKKSNASPSSIVTLFPLLTVVVTFGKSCVNIYLFIHFLYLLNPHLGHRGLLEPMSADKGYEAGYTDRLDRSPACHRACVNMLRSRCFWITKCQKIK